MSNDLIEIARFHSATEAAIARNGLEDAGIPACLDGEAMAGWFWHFGSAIGGVKLLVNREDEERASVILSSPSAIEDDDSIDLGDDSAEDADEYEQELSPELTRAFRASIMGVLVLPPILNVYSMYLIFRHRLFRSPRNWRVGMALCVNSFVLLLAIIIAATIMTPQRPPPPFHAPNGTPIEPLVDERTIPIPIVPQE